MSSTHDNMAVPIYQVRTSEGKCVPLVLALLLLGPDRKPRLPANVVAAVDRAAELTGREGVCSCFVSKEDVQAVVMGKLDKAFHIPNGIVLMLCQTTGAAERAFRWLREAYRVNLLEGELDPCIDQALVP